MKVKFWANENETKLEDALLIDGTCEWHGACTAHQYIANVSQEQIIDVAYGKAVYIKGKDFPVEIVEIDA